MKNKQDYLGEQYLKSHKIEASKIDELKDKAHQAFLAKYKKKIIGHTTTTPSATWGVDVASGIKRPIGWCKCNYCHSYYPKYYIMPNAYCYDCVTNLMPEYALSSWVRSRNF